MSSRLPPVDLTGAVVGTQKTIDFTTFVKVSGFNPGIPAQVSLLNESGCGVDVQFQASGNTTYLPAGAWGTFPLAQNDGTILITVTYVLPGPPVSVLNAVYYAPGEPVPANYTLGNSPIGGTTSSLGGIATSIVNDGNPGLTNIVEATPFGSITSKTLIDNSGNAYFDATVQVHGGIIANLITAEPGNDLARHVAAGQRTVDSVNGIDILQSASTGTKVLTGTFSLPFGLGITGISWFGPYTVGTTQATFNHNMAGLAPGTSPDVILVVLLGTSSTSAIVKVDDTTMGQTTFKATGSLAGLSFKGVAFKF